MSLVWFTAASSARGAEAPRAQEAPGVSTEAYGGAEVVGERRKSAPEQRSGSTVTAKEAEERQARSLPDALRYVPGVSIQQTSHGQASPYIRGLTGQRTLLLFDGLRLNHTLFRQGPNQYAFTIDTHTVKQAEVVRGSASVELGADALGGAILITPRDPELDPTQAGAVWSPRLTLRHATQDQERGGRIESDLQFDKKTALLAGFGYRRADELEAAGPIEGPSGKEPQSPCFIVGGEVRCADREGVPPPDVGPRRIQAGTGFREFTGDVRLVHRPTAATQLTAATYVYRQYDAPRTDKCPPPEATNSECEVYEEQFRTHAYTRASWRLGLPLFERLDFVGGWQRYHERRKLDRPLSKTVNGGRDGVSMWDFALNATSGSIPLTTAWGGLALEVHAGLAGTLEQVESKGWIIFESTGTVVNLPRGVYIDGSDASQLSTYGTAALRIADRLTLRSGARVVKSSATSPGEEKSKTRAVDGDWNTFVANGGAELRLVGPLSLLFNAEQGFRAPNLDDLTARQATGRGYQVENPDLQPERALTLEAGLRLQSRRVRAELWAFQLDLQDAMERRRADCPEGDFECRGNRAPIQLVNLDGDTELIGYEANAAVRLPAGFTLSGAVSWAEGEGPNTRPEESKARVPLSRVPPLAGNVEARWSDGLTGPYLGAALVWAREQTRLSYGDTRDARIPPDGTPAYEVVHLRGGFRFPDRMNLSVALENVFDEPHRVHGSSINGPGRGLVVQLEVNP